MWTPHYILKVLKCLPSLQITSFSYPEKYIQNGNSVSKCEQPLFCFLGNRIFKLESWLLWVTHPWSPIYGCPPWVTTEVGNGLLVPSWEEGSWPGKLLGGQKTNAHGRALHDKWRKERREEQNGHKQKLSGIVWEMDLFQKPSKPPFHKAWQGYSIEPGWQPSMALIYYCQTVCCLYLPRLTNWTFVGLAVPPENWSYCYLLHESFMERAKDLTQVVADFSSCWGCSFSFKHVVVLFLFCFVFSSSSE